MPKSKFNFNFNYETQNNNRLYILWDDNNKDEYPTDEEITEFINSISNNDEFMNFDTMEIDKGVASHFGFDNCQIFGIDG